jgi:hypothetical protein
MVADCFELRPRVVLLVFYKSCKNEPWNELAGDEILFLKGTPNLVPLELGWTALGD